MTSPSAQRISGPTGRSRRWPSASFDRFTVELDELRNVTTTVDEPVSDDDVAAHDGTHVAYDPDQMAQATQFLTHLETELPVNETEDGHERSISPTTHQL